MIEEPPPVPMDAELASLFRWQKTIDFTRRVDEFDKEAGENLLTESRFKPLREALVLRDFAVTLGYAECKLCSEAEQFPDAMVRSSNKELQIEITEVLTPGRKRHKEFQDFKNNPTEKTLSHHEWKEVREAGLNWVNWTTEAIKKKLKYSKNTKFDILVYNNISHLFDLPEIDALSKNVCELLADAGYQNHWVWQCRSTTIDLLCPRLLRLEIPSWKHRF